MLSHTLTLTRPDNPALAFHNAQLEAAAFREEFDPDNFVDLTEPNSKAIHKVYSCLDRCFHKD